MDISKTFDKIRDVLDKNPDNVSVLEEEIDVDLQMTYFKASRKIKKALDTELVLENKDLLFSDEVLEEEKKQLLLSLASVNEVIAFRTIERYLNNPDSGLKDWGTLALQESKMLLQSSLVDKAPMFISTGLGGKGHKLRYFIVLLEKTDNKFIEWQERTIQNEFEYRLKKCAGNLEEVVFNNEAAMVTALIPLQANLQELLSAVVNSCNELGGFLSESFMVTNVKKMNYQEIQETKEEQRKALEEKKKNLEEPLRDRDELGLI
ncbi:hypothetical protein DMA11_18825 [Marinilabiliaceae bacterium JC017]|nr:hypothetical protein DMA11_18825 [Marinilabiliaceae bacterium JC017]